MQKRITKTELKKFSEVAITGERFNDTLQKGFHARKLRTGTTLYYRFNSPKGGRKTVTLGKFPQLTVEKARQLVSEYAGRIASGEDISLSIKDQKQTHFNTGEAYIEDIYGSVLAKKGDGKNMLADIKNHFGNLLTQPMENLSPRMILQWQAKKEAEGLNPKTIKKIFAYFKTMLNHAANKGCVIESNPLDKFTLELRHATQEEELALREKRTYLSDEQTTMFFKGLDLYEEEKRLQRRNSRAHGKLYLTNLDEMLFADYVKPVMLTMYYTGLRPGDVSTLRWEEISLDFKRLNKVINKTRHKKPEPTVIPLSDVVIDILSKWKIQSGSPIAGFVFANPQTGKPYYKFYKPWKKIVKLGGLPEELQNYTLRHNFISQLVMSGANLLSIAKLVGTSVEMIEKHYGHLQPELLNQYVNDFANNQKVQGQNRPLIQSR